MTAPRFKVGDRVRCIKRDNKWTERADIQIGEVLTVIQLRSPGVCDSGANFSFQVEEKIHKDYCLCPLDFELVPPTTKFKIGDIVKKVKGDDSPYIGKVIEFGKKPDSIYVKIINSLSGFILKECEFVHSDLFELVTPANPLDRQENETEAEHLQRLVDKANGAKSSVVETVDLLRKLYSNKFDYADGRTSLSNTQFYGYDLNRPLIVKQFKRAFRVANWDASIYGEAIKIGCQLFNKNDLKQALLQLIKVDVTEANVPNFILRAKRSGIFCSGGHSITWEQAEELLKELEK